MRPGEGGVHRRGGLKALVSMEDGMKYEYDVPDDIDGLAVDAKNSTRFSTTSRHWSSCSFSGYRICRRRGDTRTSTSIKRADNIASYNELDRNSQYLLTDIRKE